MEKEKTKKREEKKGGEPQGNRVARLLPSLDVVAVSQAPSPESNPNSPLPVTTMVGLYPTIES